MKRIALLVPDLPSRHELAPYLARIDAARWYTNFGPLVTELEARLAATFGRASANKAKVQTVANATLGIELALLGLGLPTGSRVLVPALTFVATATSIVRAGHVPVICDVDPATWLLTPSIARECVSQAGAAAVVPVSTYGCPQDINEWDRFAAETGFGVLIDAAGAFGNQTGSGQVGAVFSLHATKGLGAGEGGFVVSTDGALLADIRRLSNFGIDVSTGYVPSPGTNAKLSEYHAAVALAGLDSWAEHRVLRIALHRRYLDVIAARCPRVSLQERPADGVYTIMPVVLPEGHSARTVAQRLAARGIETRRWYCPTLDRHPAFENLPIAGTLSVAGRLNERLLALPFHLQLSQEDIDTVCTDLARAIETS